jgi:hypothetical protein
MSAYACGTDGMIVQHEQNAGDHQNQKRAKRQRAQKPCCAESHHALAYFGGEQVKEDVLLDR